jgi:hypothetical protein
MSGQNKLMQRCGEVHQLCHQLQASCQPQSCNSDCSNCAAALGPTSPFVTSSQPPRLCELTAALCACMLAACTPAAVVDEMFASQNCHASPLLSTDICLMVCHPVWPLVRFMSGVRLRKNCARLS